jgi:predicted transcriptional regulator
MKLSEIRDILEATVLACENQLQKKVVAVGGADLMSDILAATAKDAVLLTGLNTEHAFRTGHIAEVGAIVFVRGKRPDEKIMKMAETYNIPVLSTQCSLFVASGRLYMNGLRGLNGSW